MKWKLYTFPGSYDVLTMSSLQLQTLLGTISDLWLPVFPTAQKWQVKPKETRTACCWMGSLSLASSNFKLLALSVATALATAPYPPADNFSDRSAGTSKQLYPCAVTGIPRYYQLPSLKTCYFKSGASTKIILLISEAKKTLKAQISNVSQTISGWCLCPSHISSKAPGQ